MLLILTALSLLAAAPAAPPAQTAPPAFRPDLFFAGRTRGTGTVTVATSERPRALSVNGVGRIEADGALVLDQAITIDGKLRNRTFRIRAVGGSAWEGSLTDAAGPVRGTVTGNRLTLAYRMGGAGMRMNQTLTLQPDGRTVINRARVTLLGVQVARIDETIAKLD